MKCYVCERLLGLSGVGFKVDVRAWGGDVHKRFCHLSGGWSEKISVETGG